MWNLENLHLFDNGDDWNIKEWQLTYLEKAHYYLSGALELSEQGTEYELTHEVNDLVDELEHVIAEIEE